MLKLFIPTTRRPALGRLEGDVSRRSCLTAIAATLIAGCTTTPTSGAGDEAAADPAEARRLQAARFLLLGEVHDNPEHHRLRAALLAGLLADRRRSTCVVFEQMAGGHDEAIDAARAEGIEAVITAGGWDRAGWQWPLHRPVVAAALAGGATVRGGDIAPETAEAIVRTGAAAVPVRSSRLMARLAWSPADEARVEADIDSGHCGMLPARLWPAMALAQRARDAALADAMLTAGQAHDRVVLIAGNGHVRRDLGVPRYLIAGGVPPREILSVGDLEQADPAAPYDLTRVTAPVERPDPCEAFRRR